MTGERQISSLVLASASEIRGNLLHAAGIKFSVQPADIDEDAVRAVLDISGDGMPPGDIGLVLAEAKASAIAALNPDALVIGADQILALDGEIFTKPESVAAAHRQLMRLRGQTHELHAGICCVRGDQTLWRYTDVAQMAVRDFSESFLQNYLNREGEAVCTSVGAYRLEGLGAQLFKRIDGDYFTILGLPLLPLLEFLRSIGEIEQ